MDDFFQNIAKRGLNSLGLVEVGKAILAFANIITALSIVNIVYKQQNPLIYGTGVFVSFIMLYLIGYKFIKRGDNS